MNEMRLKFYTKMYEVYKEENLTLKTQLQYCKDKLDKLIAEFVDTIELYKRALICATEQAEESFDKLEKIREYVEHNDFSDWHIGQDKDEFRKNEILQILNEGKSENN